VIKAEFSASLLQFSMSHDPSENTDTYWVAHLVQGNKCTEML